MAYEIEFDPDALKDPKKLDRPILNPTGWPNFSWTMKTGIARLIFRALPSRSHCPATSKGLNTRTPNGLKSATLRVTTVRSWTTAVAAIMASS